MKRSFSRKYRDRKFREEKQKECQMPKQLKKSTKPIDPDQEIIDAFNRTWIERGIDEEADLLEDFFDMPANSKYASLETDDIRKENS